VSFGRTGWAKMSDFGYVAIDPEGRTRRGRVTADTITQAESALVARKLFVVRVEAGRPEEPNARALFTGRRDKMSTLDLVLFTRQLATLAEVSPLEEALRTIERQTEAQGPHAVVRRVQQGLVEGHRLSDTMRRESTSFPPLYVAMVAAGETSGRLPLILTRLALLLERQEEVRTRVFAALAYPIIVAVVAIFVVGALMVLVVPQVVEQFDSFGQTLPLLTRIVISVSSFLTHFWWALIVVAVTASLGVVTVLRTPSVRLRADRIILRLPVVGRLARARHAARMARTLATMVASHLPLLDGLMLTTPTIRNLALRQASETMIESVRGGGSFAGAMERTGVFPPLMVYLTASGESAGQLDMMLERAADHLEREFDRFATTGLSLLEPLIIVVMGALVALIVLSIMLPILQLQSLVGQ
jgi:general secretion pathway protein F